MSRPDGEDEVSHEITLAGLSAFDEQEPAPERDTLVPPSVGSPARNRSPEWTAPGAHIAERYEIEQVLGAGGMGQVFRVRHLGLDKRFALKLMHVDISTDEETRAQFYREARVASSLAHPNIVSVVDFGEDARLGAYMVMELLDGKKLSAQLHHEGPVAQKPWCDVMLQLAEAAHHIHQHGIVHGDIKPDNIMLCEVPSTDRRKLFVKLLDFGLARDSAPEGPRAGSVSGTPHYMAPERLRGEPPQPAMDIYSVGVVGYELLTGRPPFDGMMNEVIQGHLQREVPPLARGGVTIDERAEALIMRALAKRPADRQKDMAAFLYELRTLMAMLGMGRRRAVSTSRVRASGPDTGGGSSVKLLNAAPIPLAGVDADGRVVVANRAFARFVCGDANAPIAGLSLAATRIVEVYPEIMAELRHVHISAEQCRRVIRLHSSKRDEDVEMLVWMTPGETAYGDVVLVLHTLPRR